MWNITVLSFEYGLSIAFICTFISCSWFLGISRFSYFFNRRKHSGLQSRLEALAILPAMAIHPTIIAVYTFDVISPYLFGRVSIFSLDRTCFGILFIGTILYLPFSHFVIASLPIDKWLSQQRYVISLGLGQLRSWVTFVFIPLILGAIPIFLSLTILTQGMVFTPTLSMSRYKATIGRELYDYIASSTRSYNSALLLAIILFLGVIVVICLSVVILKYGSSIKSKIAFLLFRKTFQIKLIKFKNKVPVLYFNEKTKYFLDMIVNIFLISPFSIVIIFQVIIISTMFIIVIKAVNEIGFMAILRNVFQSAHGPTLWEAIKSTATISLIVSIIGTAIVLWIAFVVGRRDGWVLGKTNKIIRVIVVCLALIPPAIYTFSINKYLILYPWTSIILLLTIISISLGMLGLQESLFGRIFRLERFRISLALSRLNFWPKTYSKFGKVVFVFMLWVGLLSWNDIVVQLFATSSFLGLPNVILPIAKDGITIETEAALAFLQIAVCTLSFPICYLAFQQIRRAQS